MTKIRKNASQGFTTINNHIVRDDSLSWKARGLFTYLWSLPEDWNFYASEVTKHAPDGGDSTRTGLKELENAGYLERSREVKENGQLGAAIWILNDIPKPKSKKPILEKPMLENPSKNQSSDTDNPKQEKPMLENPTQVNPIQEDAIQENPKLLNTNLTNKISNKININNSQAAELHDDIPFKEIIDYLNNKTGGDYQATAKTNQRLIKARWNEGQRLDDFKKVIDVKCNEWLNNPKMFVYLRPSTLFGSKFQYYKNQAKMTSNLYTPKSNKSNKRVITGIDWRKRKNQKSNSSIDMSDEELNSIFAEFSRGE